MTLQSTIPDTPEKLVHASPTFAKPSGIKRLTPRQLEILQAALVCFLRSGIEATTIEMIREQSGASVGSLYHHFGNKEGIAAAVYKEGLRQFSQQLRLALQDVASIEVAIRCIIEVNITWIVANPDWARFVFLHRRVLQEAEQEQDFRVETVQLHRMLTRQFEQFSDFKRLRVLPEQAYLSVLVGSVHHYARQWLDGVVEVPLIDLKEDFVQIALRGLLD